MFAPPSRGSPDMKMEERAGVKINSHALGFPLGIEAGTARLAQETAAVNLGKVVRAQLFGAEQMQHMPVDFHAQRFHHVAGERFAPESELVINADERVEPAAIEGKHRFGMQQRIAQGEHGIDRVFGRTPVAAGEFQVFGEQVARPFEIGRCTGASGTVPTRSPFS